MIAAIKNIIIRITTIAVPTAGLKKFSIFIQNFKNISNFRGVLNCTIIRVIYCSVPPDLVAMKTVSMFGEFLVADVLDEIFPQLHRVFKITNLDKVFRFFPDKESAVKTINDG